MATFGSPLKAEIQQAMTPFSSSFKAYRQRRRLRQKQVAHAMGLSVSYVSSWETALKAPPNGELLARLCAVFELSGSEAEGFKRAAEISRPLLRMPKATPTSGYALAHRLVAELPRLGPRQIDLINGILELTTPEAIMNP